MIRRDLHPTCDNCWARLGGNPKSMTRNLHHFFTYDRHPQCCWCGSPSHGQWWKAPRLEAPCRGLTGFHSERAAVVNLDDMRRKYEDDPEIQTLIDIARSLQAELVEYERNRYANQNAS